MRNYLLFGIPTVLILWGGIGMFFSNSDINTIVLVLGVISLIVLGFFSISEKTLVGRDYPWNRPEWPNRVQNICQRYNGRMIELTGKEAGLEEDGLNYINSYKVEFEYKSYNIQYFDTITEGYSSTTVAPRYNIGLFFKTSVLNNLGLYIQQSVGDSFIGKNLDALKTKQGYKEITSTASLIVPNRFKIYSNDEYKALKFLADPDVQRIYLKYLAKLEPTIMVDTSVPIRIFDGYVYFIFEGLGSCNLALKQDDDLNPYLDDLTVLANKLS